MAGFLGKGRVRRSIDTRRLSEKFDRRTGSAATYVDSHLNRVKTLAEKNTPRRTGELKRGHRLSGVLKVGRYEARGEVYNVAEHAEWVHQGTRPLITSLSGDRMPVPRRRGGPPAISSRSTAGRGAAIPYDPKVHRARDWVRGQEGNPWLADAAAAARKLKHLDAYLARLVD